jgi:hypothetical protein
LGPFSSCNTLKEYTFKKKESQLGSDGTHHIVRIYDKVSISPQKSLQGQSQDVKTLDQQQVDQMQLTSL